MTLTRLVAVYVSLAFYGWFKSSEFAAQVKPNPLKPLKTLTKTFVKKSRNLGLRCPLGLMYGPPVLSEHRTRP